MYMTTDDLLIKIHEELKFIKEEIGEIKEALIPEDDPSEAELAAIETADREIEEGRYRSWKDMREELD